MKAEYIDHMGTDLSVVNAARVSFAKLSKFLKGPDGQNDLSTGDVGLLRFLARGLMTNDWDDLVNRIVDVNDKEDAAAIVKEIHHISTHWTPFAHTAISVRMCAPLPIRTQCFKHKQGLTENEESRRYISSEPEIFLPVFREKATNKKQGSGPEIKGEDKNTIDIIYRSAVMSAVETYKYLLCKGVCEEQARFVLPQGTEVNWVWTGNLFSFANFYNKRSKSDAQKEIQDLAKEVGDIIAPLFPYSWAALTE